MSRGGAASSCSCASKVEALKCEPKRFTQPITTIKSKTYRTFTGQSIFSFKNWVPSVRRMISKVCGRILTHLISFAHLKTRAAAHTPAGSRRYIVVICSDTVVLFFTFSLFFLPQRFRHISLHPAARCEIFLVDQTSEPGPPSGSNRKLGPPVVLTHVKDIAQFFWDFEICLLNENHPKQAEQSCLLANAVEQRSCKHVYYI